ncbi:MAG: glutamine-hydrolyzing GMP synthase, partial [Candidatus Diapherotrites archaeon]|nr:glutamine-hydrolyzing GMP synthase [Candidatus Diapherotrites archaeon]
IFSLKKPILGLCYGQQLMAHQLGGRVEKGNVREYGLAELHIKNHEKLFDGLPKRETVWMSHGDKVSQLPEGFETIGSTPDCENAAFADFSRNYFGLQFHPEVTHTTNGLEILKNFAFNVCNCRPDWTIENFLQQKVEEIKKQTGNKKVFLLASGGVDSTVALALLNKALPRESVYAMHVDTGFMRKSETREVEQALRELNFSELHVVNASEEFFEKLKGTIEPEKKREIVGQAFIEVQNKELEKLNLNPDEWLLGQGTIYPDTIETAGTKHAAKIKTHHNRVESIKQLIEEGRVIEPIAELYKDEVRELGKELGLASHLVERQPFPGPGLAIRCLCSNGKAESQQELGESARQASEKFGFNATVLPVKSVGVQGDARTYASTVLLQGRTDWKKAGECSTAITNSLSEVNRVVLSIAPEKISSIRLVKASLTRQRIALLQEADNITTGIVESHGLMARIWQFPVVMLPLEVNGHGEAIVLRPIESREAMTARFFEMPHPVLKEISENLMQLEGIGAVFYDVTHKPPATIEWE